MIVYKATNQINGKVYIGQTTRVLPQRISHHLWNANNNDNNYFHNAINKYGIKNFKWEIIRICDNIESLNAFEQYYILYYDSINSGYNLTSGGLNYIVSEKTKEKYRKRKFTKEQRKKMSMVKIGVKLSNETKKRMSLSQRNVSDETKRRRSVAALGRHHTEATKKKMSVSKLNMSDKTKQLISKNHAKYWLGKKHSEEAKKKMSLARSKYWKNIRNNK